LNFETNLFAQKMLAVFSPHPKLNLQVKTRSMTEIKTELLLRNQVSKEESYYKGFH
jgi:hypothetical protein